MVLEVSALLIHKTTTMKKFLLLLLVCSTSILSAQVIPTFVKHYLVIGNEFGYTVAQTAEDGYMIAGTIDRNDYDILVIKTNELGDTLWSKIYEEAGEEVAQEILKTSDGGFVIVGRKDLGSDGKNDVYLLKINSSGTKEWSKTYGGTDDDWARSIAETSDGGFILAGATRSSGNGDYDVYLLKVSGSGTEQWSKTFGAEKVDFANSVLQTSDGGFILTGVKGINVTYRDMYIIRTNSTGDSLWTRTFGGEFDDGGTSIKQATDGGFVSSGWRTDNAGDMDVYVVKLSPTGSTDWTTVVGIQNSNEYASSIALTADGGYVMGGDQTPNGLFVKTNAAGKVSWTKKLVINADTTSIQSVILTTDGGFAAVGFTLNSQNRIFLLKSDSLGKELTSLSKELSMAQNTLLLYPNPMEEYTILDFSETETPFFVEIFDLTGKKVKRVECERSAKEIKILKSGITPGAYIVKATAASGKIYSSRLIIQ